VQAVVHLVASSVPLMSTENVTIVDNQGKLITDTNAESALGLTSAQTQHKQKMEDVYRQRVEQILAPIVGDANVRSQVNMSLDFTQTETTTEDFDNRKEGPKTRSEALSEDKNTLKDATGIPGALSNTPPVAPTANTNTTSTATGAAGDKMTSTNRSTRNFELDRSVRYVKNATGTVERLSVAVVINERPPQTKNEKGEPMDPKPNPYTEEEVTRMQSLVRGVVGFNEARGDVVAVVQAKFEPEQVFDMSVPWYKDEVVVNNLKTGLLGLMFVAFIMMVIRPAVMHFMPPPPPPVDPALAAAVLADGELSEEDKKALQEGGAESMEELKAKMMPKKSNISAEMLDTANTYDDKVALVRIIVADDAARVASVLKNMIKST
jgi:flagellar M-ring protein FliF